MQKKLLTRTILWLALTLIPFSSAFSAVINDNYYMIMNPMSGMIYNTSFSRYHTNPHDHMDFLSVITEVPELPASGVFVYYKHHSNFNMTNFSMFTGLPFVVPPSFGNLSTYLSDEQEWVGQLVNMQTPAQNNFTHQIMLMPVGVYANPGFVSLLRSVTASSYFVNGQRNIKVFMDFLSLSMEVCNFLNNKVYPQEMEDYASFIVLGDIMELRAKYLDYNDYFTSYCDNAWYLNNRISAVDMIKSTMPFDQWSWEPYPSEPSTDFILYTNTSYLNETQTIWLRVDVQSNQLNYNFIVQLEWEPSDPLVRLKIIQNTPQMVSVRKNSPFSSIALGNEGTPSASVTFPPVSTNIVFEFNPVYMPIISTYENYTNSTVVVSTRQPTLNSDSSMLCENIITNMNYYFDPKTASYSAEIQFNMTELLRLQFNMTRSENFFCSLYLTFQFNDTNFPSLPSSTVSVNPTVLIWGAKNIITDPRQVFFNDGLVVFVNNTPNSTVSFGGALIIDDPKLTTNSTPTRNAGFSNTSFDPTTVFYKSSFGQTGVCSNLTNPYPANSQIVFEASCSSQYVNNSLLSVAATYVGCGYTVLQFGMVNTNPEDVLSLNYQFECTIVYENSQNVNTTVTYLFRNYVYVPPITIQTNNTPHATEAVLPPENIIPISYVELDTYDLNNPFLVNRAPPSGPIKRSVSPQVNSSFILLGSGSISVNKVLKNIQNSTALLEIMSTGNLNNSAGVNVSEALWYMENYVQQSLIPTSSPTPAPTSSTTPSPTSSQTPSPTSSTTPSPTSSTKPSSTPSTTPSPTSLPTLTPTSAVKPTLAPTHKPTPMGPVHTQIDRNSGWYVWGIIAIPLIAILCLCLIAMLPIVNYRS